jgi:ADP-heptose:LPS heptosyltransferase
MSALRRRLDTWSGFGTGYDAPPTPALRARGWLQAQIKLAVRRVLRVALGTLGTIDAGLHFGRRLPPLHPTTFHPRRILVVRTDMLGDMLLTLPAIHVLRRAYPDARIDVATKPGNAPLLSGHPDIDGIITCDPASWPEALTSPAIRHEALATMRTLRRARYDLALSMCGDWGSVVTRLSGARRRVGYDGEAYAHFMTDPVPGARYRERQHEVDYCLSLAEHAGGTVDPIDIAARCPALHVGDDARQRVELLLAEYGVGIYPTPHPLSMLTHGEGAMDRQDPSSCKSAPPIVALHPGSGNGKAKRWPLPYWARLADSLACEEVVAVLVGAPSDAPLAQGIKRRMRQPERVVDLVGATSLPELVALLERCTAIVTGDSGPMHVAAAVGTPVVAIFGPTDPAVYGPLSDDATILRRDLWCSPCYDPAQTADCRFFNPICMKGIGPAEVLAATRRYLSFPAPEDAPTMNGRTTETKASFGA